ncbi:hypothetical protein L228DRAFT_267608 [Xylona heveae TC161]|uniref:Synaptobrevin n=1 Tax=Xylona heveae (strain CBS 132557 / TC161) TaxID=1328760 RepID=A0A161TCT8_XYLHT|nr:hypothetical protein L228DRAFT_267608 [Xylona heveae TC161]KZF23627.1 hypothetical protein L228DRAFT_267608 [Xylona heveae TC161]
MARDARTATQGLSPASVDLTRLLSRLERVILHPDNPVDLSRSPYERTKIGANLEYARSLLLRLEHENSAVRIQSKKHSAQVDLSQKRELIRKLNERLYELGQVDDEAWQEDEVETNSDDEAEREAFPRPTDGGKKENEVHAEFGGLDQKERANYNGGAESSNTLRSRRRVSLPTDSGLATGSSLSQTAKTENLLSHNRTEQESLTTSLLNMAEALKASSLRFGQSLEAEKEILDRAGQGLEKNVSSMEAAEKRMGTLRRMTEGKGWWGRMLMYAWITGLMILAFAIVFVMPKLRF